MLLSTFVLHQWRHREDLHSCAYFRTVKVLQGERVRDGLTPHIHISRILGREQEYGWPFLVLSHPGHMPKVMFTSQGSVETLSNHVLEVCCSISWERENMIFLPNKCANGPKGPVSYGWLTWCWWSRFQNMVQTQVRSWDGCDMLDQLGGRVQALVSRLSLVTDACTGTHPHEAESGSFLNLSVLIRILPAPMAQHPQIWAFSPSLLERQETDSVGKVKIPH